MTLHARPFNGDDDAHLLAGIVTRAALATPQCSYWHVGDVWWGLYQNTVFDSRHNIHLWFDEAAPVGFAWFFPSGSVSTQVVPGRADGAVLEAEMLGWAEERRRTISAVDGEPITLTATAFAHDAPRIALLTGRGYERVGTPMYHFHRALSGPVAPTPPAIGMTVRQVGEEPEWGARVEIHRDVWHPSKVTLDAYRRLRAAPGYRPELDLVAVTAQGAFASYCICWLDPATQTGEFEPVGTRPAFRRRRLGQAVIVEGLRRLREHGATQAIVYTPLYKEAARPHRRRVGIRWAVDEPYIRLAGRWVYAYRAIDEHGQVIDVYLSETRDTAAATAFFAQAIARTGVRPQRVTTDKAAAYPPALRAVVPDAEHITGKIEQQGIERDHQHLKGRTRSMRGFQQIACAQVVCDGHGFMRNLRDGFYRLGEPTGDPRIPQAPRLARAWDDRTQILAAG